MDPEARTAALAWMERDRHPAYRESPPDLLFGRSKDGTSEVAVLVATTESLKDGTAKDRATQLRAWQERGKTQDIARGWVVVCHKDTSPVDLVAIRGHSVTVTYPARDFYPKDVRF